MKIKILILTLVSVIILSTIPVYANNDMRENELKYDSYNELIKDSDIKVLHDNMKVWEWEYYDKDYLDKKKYGTKNQLKNEIEVLKQALYSFENMRIYENGFYYYPTFLSLKLDIIDRSISARKSILSDKYIYPTKFDSKKFGCRLTKYDFDWNSSYFIENRVIYSDLMLLETIQKYPYPFFKNLKIITSPYPTSHSGTCTRIDEIYITTGTRMSSSIFYHEIGHMWAWHYLKEDYKDYLKIRNEKLPVEITEFNATQENFAEDFKIVMDENPLLIYLTSFGIPNEKLKKELKEYFLEISETKSYLSPSFKNTFLYIEEK